MDTENMQWGLIAIGLIGGLSFFLYGMEKMTGALKIIAGDRLKNVLERLTTNRLKAVLAGAFVTATIQSSSVTTVLVVGFISAGLLSMSQSIGIIMGAEIGTTMTAQIIAFKVTRYALLLVAVGFMITFFIKKETLEHYGAMIMGLGMIFFGMEMMSNATRPLQSYDPFIDMLKALDNPVSGILASAIFTALVQSSSATTGIIIVLAGQGFIPLEAGIALVFGANVGTCITAFLASIGKPREAVRAATAHILFNVMGILIWIGFIDHLADLVRWLSPAAVELDGVARLAAETPRQIANAHTVFNVSNTFIFIWFTPLLAALIHRIIPEPVVEESKISEPRYLDEIMLQTPALALDIVRMELGRLGASALHMVRSAVPPVIKGTKEELNELEHMEGEVNAYHGALITYLGRMSQENLTDRQRTQLHGFISAANYMRNIGDIIETNLVNAGMARLENNVQISKQTRMVLTDLSERTAWAVERSIQALVGQDRDIAQEVIDAKAVITDLADRAEGHISMRLTAAEPHRLIVFQLETEMIEYLKRVYYFAKRIAKVVAEIDINPEELFESEEHMSA